MGVFLLKMTDGSEMILTAGRATRTDTGDIAFENLDARGDWTRTRTVSGSQVETAYRRRTGDDGREAWVAQPEDGRWWA
ncbi:hypothetical protein [Streptomyces sp. URMC 125]|uniref:hypothetical protein n=1 Tax=Streptomyces sp. URMC 125 TaxID=3423419 RepID=UPI003F1D8304